jgi:hypothetical protein
MASARARKPTRRRPRLSTGREMDHGSINACKGTGAFCRNPSLVGLDPDPTGLRLRTTDLGQVEASVETWPEEEICSTDGTLISGGWQGGGFLPG